MMNTLYLEANAAKKIVDKYRMNELSNAHKIASETARENRYLVAENSLMRMVIKQLMRLKDERDDNSL